MGKKAFIDKETAQLFQAQVVASHGRHHFVRDSLGHLYEAHRRGKKGDVVVGDMVQCLASFDNTAAIETIRDRTSLLFRQDEWRTKTLASNIDLLAIVYASRPRFNPWFVWKALLAAHQAGVRPVIIRNKTDIAEDAKEASDFLVRMAALGYETYSISAEKADSQTLDVLNTLFHGHRSLLVGQSGMGKSTILNLLVKGANAKTREYSEALNLGKQTTTSTTLYDLDSGDGFIIDSPGFQEFGLAHLSEEDIIEAMPDIKAHVGQCRFSNCRHLKEPNCSVKAAVQAGVIAQDRYDFYVAMLDWLDRQAANRY